jgi:hypothetical protein
MLNRRSFIPNPLQPCCRTLTSQGVAVSLFKFEILIAKVETNPMPETVLLVGTSSFDIVQDFVIRPFFISRVEDTDDSCFDPTAREGQLPEAFAWRLQLLCCCSPLLTSSGYITTDQTEGYPPVSVQMYSL